MSFSTRFLNLVSGKTKVNDRICGSIFKEFWMAFGIRRIWQKRERRERERERDYMA